MLRSSSWLTAATVALVFFSQTLAAPFRAHPSEPVLAARYGAELGILASTGANLGEMPAGAPRDEGPEAANTPAPDGGTAAAETPSATPQPTPASKGKLIVIDPGHGGAESGAVHTAANGREDLVEKEVNLSIAHMLADLLRQDGYEARLTHDDDTRMVPGGAEVADLQARVDLANQAGADLFISIHHNGSTDRSMRGTQVYYCNDRPYAASNQRLASLAQEAIVRNLRAAGYDDVDLGIRDDASEGHLALLAPANLPRPSRMPAILGEALFMSNDEDAAQLQRPEIREAIARGYSEAIKAYFGETP